MSKWYKVELNSKQKYHLDSTWDWENDSVGEERWKTCSYRTVIDKNGETKVERTQLGVAYKSEELTHLFKFKNEIEAMAFKLQWS